MVEVLKTIIRVLDRCYDFSWEPGQWNSMIRSCKEMNRWIKNILKNESWMCFKKLLLNNYTLESVWDQRSNWCHTYIWKNRDRSSPSRILWILYRLNGELLSVHSDFYTDDLDTVRPYIQSTLV